MGASHLVKTKRTLTDELPTDKEFEMGEMDFQPLPEGREREEYHTFTSASHLGSIS